MRLRVRVETTGSMVEVDVLPQLMVLAVKEIMALHTSIPVSCQQLWWRGKLLSDSSVLKDVLPPMFFHASLDTITPDYYKLLLHHHDNRKGDYKDGDGDDDEGREGLEDLDRVKREAFLTLKVVNPPTSTATASTLGLSLGMGSVRSASTAAAVAAPASLRNLYLSQAAEGRRHVAVFGSSSEDEIDEDGDGGRSWQRFQETRGTHRDSKDRRQRRGQQKQQQQQQSHSSRSSRDGHYHHHHHHHGNNNKRATIIGRTQSPTSGGARSGASGSGSDSGSRNVPSFTISPVDQWSVRETAGWLASLGRAYHRYCHEFVESGIDGNMLLEICRDENAGRQYLKELGVKSIHSAKLFFEIRQRQQQRQGQRAAGGASDARTRGGHHGLQGMSIALTQQQFNDRGNGSSSGMTSTPTGHRSFAAINTPSRYHNPHLFEKNQKQLLKFRHMFQEQADEAQASIKSHQETIIKINENQASQNQQIYHYCSNLRNIVDLLESQLIDEVRTASDALVDRCQRNIRHCGDREVALRRKLERVKELSRGTSSDSAEIVEFLDDMQLRAAEDEQNQHSLLEAQVQANELPRLDVMDTVQRLNNLIEDQPIDI